MKSILIVFVFSLIYLLTFTYSKPVIGILTHPIPDDPNIIEEGFLNLNYVKWIEASGGEIVPIHSWFDDQQLDEIFNKVNGIIFQGGSASLDFDLPYYKISEKIFNKVVEYKDKYNKILPLWGTCLGFEALHLIVSKNKNILKEFDAEDIKSKLILEDEINKKSIIFSYFSDQDIINMREKELTAQYHHFGVSPLDFFQSKELNSFFKINSFAFDRNKKIYIGTIEAKIYSIFATQFHPEKTNFIKFKQEVPQGIEASQVAENFVDVFMNLARLNENKMNIFEREKFGLVNTFTKKTDIVGKSACYIYRKSTIGLNKENIQAENTNNFLEFLE